MSTLSDHCWAGTESAAHHGHHGQAQHEHAGAQPGREPAKLLAPINREVGQARRDRGDQRHG